MRKKQMEDINIAQFLILLLVLFFQNQTPNLAYIYCVEQYEWTYR